MSHSDLQSIRAELADIKSRILGIEQRLGQATQPASADRPRPSPSSAPDPRPRTQIRLEQTEPPTKVETGRLMGVIGSICIILAAVFLIKMSIDSGWLTPNRQVLGAFLLGILLVVVGVLFRASDRQYLSLLPAAGLSVLYLAVLGGCYYATLYSDRMGLLGVGMVSVAAIGLYRILAIGSALWLAVIGTYLGPVVLFFGNAAPYHFDLMIYFGFWNLTYCVLSILFAERSGMVLATFLGIWSFFILSLEKTFSESIQLAFQSFQAATFVAGHLYFSWKHRVSLTTGEAWVLFPSLLLYYGVSYYLLRELSPEAAPYLALGFALLLNGLYVITRKHFEEDHLASGTMLNTFFTLVLVHITIFVLPPEWSMIPWIALGYSVLLFALRPQLDLGGVHLPYLLGVLILLIFASIQIFLGADFNSLGELIALGSVYTIVALVASRAIEAPSFSKLLLFVAHAQALFALYRLADLIDSSSRFFVSLFWLIYAIAILSWGYSKKDVHLARSSLMIFGVASAKALLYDVSSSQPLVRVACFLILGAALYGGGYLFRRIESWES